MGKNFKYAILDIKYNKRQNIISFIQFLVSFFLLSLVIKELVGNEIFLKNIQKNDGANTYYIEENSSEEFISEFLSAEDSKAKLSTFINALMDNEKISFYSKYRYDQGEVFNGEMILEYYISEKFIDYNKLDVLNGTSLDKNSFSNNTEYTPILVGYDIKDKYGLSNIYEFTDSDGEIFKGKVVGILKDNSSFKDLRYNNTNYLNSAVIIPLTNEKIKHIKSVGDLDMLINNAIVMSGDGSIISEFEELARDLNIFNLKFVSLEENYEKYMQSSIQKSKYFAYISVFICSFAIIGTIAGINNLINKKKREFAINRLCGGSFKDICIRISIEICLIIIFAMIPSLLITGISVESIIISIIGVIIIIISLILPILKIKKLNISIDIRGNVKND